MERLRATNDDIEVLEVVLDRLQERGIHVSRLRVGNIELDIASVSPSPTERSEVNQPLPPADPAQQAVPGGRGRVYGSSNLWPLGAPPQFDPPKTRS